VAGGATEIFVRDGHMGGGNFIDGLLDGRAHLLAKGQPLPEGVVAGMRIGAHTMGGVLNAFLDHTCWHGHVFSIHVNGRAFGEIGLEAARLGQHGIPLVAVSGCEMACKEARDFVGELAFAPVKRAVGRSRAVLVEPDEAHQRIRDAAEQGLARVGEIAPFRVIFPVEMIEVYCRTELADRAAQKGDDVERIDARTVRKIAHAADEPAFAL